MSTKARKKDKVIQIENYLTNKAKLKCTVDKLPVKTVECLKTVLKKEGLVKIGSLTKKYGNFANDSYFWKEKTPQSTIGLLRVNGLLVVGKAKFGGKKYKSVVIPQNIKDTLADLLGC